MSELNEEITFSQIFELIKKSFVRLTLYVLVSVALVISSLLTARSLSSFTTSQTTIWVSAESNVLLSDLNYNKALAVQKALNQDQNSTESEDESSAILSALSINAIVPSSLDEKALTEFIPTSFTLTLNGNGLELTNEQLNALLDDITKELLSTLALSELPKLQLSNNLQTDLQVLEYFQIADELYLQADDVYNVIARQLNGKNDTNKYLSPQSGFSLNDVLANVSSAMAKIDNLKNYIIANRIENVNSLEEMLTLKKNQANIEHEAYKAMADQALKVLSGFPSPTPTAPNAGNTSTVVIDSQAYENLANKYYGYIDLQRSANRELKQYEEYLNIINPLTPNADPAKADYVKATLSQILTEISLAIDDYKVISKEYNDNYYSTVDTKIVTPARTITNNNISVTTILLIALATAILASLVAITQVYSKSKKIIAKEPIKEILDKP